MEEIIFWCILFVLIIIVGNQVRERQERETKGMPKKQKEKYFQEIKNKQKENAKVLYIILAIIILVIILFGFWFYYADKQNVECGNECSKENSVCMSTYSGRAVNAWNFCETSFDSCLDNC